MNRIYRQFIRHVCVMVRARKISLNNCYNFSFFLLRGCAGGCLFHYFTCSDLYISFNNNNNNNNSNCSSHCSSEAVELQMVRYLLTMHFCADKMLAKYKESDYGKNRKYDNLKCNSVLFIADLNIFIIAIHSHSNLNSVNRMRANEMRMSYFFFFRRTLSLLRIELCNKSFLFFFLFNFILYLIFDFVKYAHLTQP